MSDRRILLTRSAQQAYSASTQGFRFTVTASDANLMPNEVFRFLRRPINPAIPAGEILDTFAGVCTPTELITLPVNNPYPDAQVAYYRSLSVDVRYESQQQGDFAWNQIIAAVTALKDAMDLQDVLAPPTSLWIGTPP